MDERITDRDQFFFRFTRGVVDNFLSNGYNGSPITLDGAANMKNLHMEDVSGSFSYTRVFGAAFFGETLVNFGAERRKQAPGDLSKDYISMLGFPNPYGEMGFPEIGQTGFNTDYREKANALEDYTRTINVDQNFTRISGRHEFQFGGHFRHETLDVAAQQQYVRGNHTANSLATALYDPNSGSRYTATNRTGHNAANLYLGVFGVYSVARARKWYNFSDQEHAGYLQDNWKLTSRLTLNLGLRVESYPMLKERNNVLTGFDPVSKSIVLGQPLDFLYQIGATDKSVVQKYQSMGIRFATPEQAGVPHGLMAGDLFDYNPRLGFAYRLSTGARPLVLRGGFSRFSFPIQLRYYVQRSRNNTPMTFRLRQDYNAAATSPDGKANYLLRNVPQYVAGVNTANLLDRQDPDVGAAGSTGAVYFDPYQPTSRANQWNMTMEREILRNTVVRAALIGTHGSKLEQLYDYNEQMPQFVWFSKTGLPLPEGEMAGVAMRQWNTLPYGNVERYQKTGWSNYTGVQLELERRYTRGMAFHLSYVTSNAARAGGSGWSDDIIQDPWVFPVGAVPEDFNERNRFLNYHRDTTIPKHRLRWNGLLDLPVGRGKWLLHDSRGIVNALVGGWQIAALGSLRSTYFALPTADYGPQNPIEIFGKKYPVQDCRSGACIPGYLWYNGYISPNRINSYDANGKPTGVMGVPEGYVPSHQPVNNDPGGKNFSTNIVYIQMKNGTLQQTTLDDNLHPWRNQVLPGPRLINMDASLFKAMRISERFKLRLNVDFFNVFNMPGLDAPNSTSGIVALDSSAQNARQLQLTLRLLW